MYIYYSSDDTQNQTIIIKDDISEWKSITIGLHNFNFYINDITDQWKHYGMWDMLTVSVFIRNRGENEIFSFLKATTCMKLLDFIFKDN